MMTELLNTRKELDVKLNHRQKKMVSVCFTMFYVMSHVLSPLLYHIMYYVTSHVLSLYSGAILNNNLFIINIYK